MSKRDELQDTQREIIRSIRSLRQYWIESDLPHQALAVQIIQLNRQALELERLLDAQQKGS